MMVIISGCATGQMGGIGGDDFESNDQIFKAKQIQLGTPIKATIDPPGDRDFYKVKIPKSSGSGVVSVLVENPSENLNIQMLFYNEQEDFIQSASADQRGAPEVVGGFKVSPNRTYYMVVFSGRNRYHPSLDEIDNQYSTEPYTLVATLR
jgi:hypothetical protein